MNWRIWEPPQIDSDVRADLEAQATAELFGASSGKVEDADGSKLFEQYKLMVASSEALVSRRQSVNTFFLTVTGLILTAAGLVIKAGGDQRLQAGAVLLLSLPGLFLCWSWRSLLISFGQLNGGKFRVINAMEERLPARIYSAEWKALGSGERPDVYGSFTNRESFVPLLFGLVYLVSSVLSFLVWIGCLRLGKP